MKKTWRPASLLKKEALAQVFSCEFYEISKNTFFTEQLWATASESPDDVFRKGDLFLLLQNK